MQMWHLLRPRVAYSLAFFLLAFAVLVTAGRRELFLPDGKPRPFGLGGDRTIFSLGFCAQGLAVLGTALFATADASEARQAAVTRPAVMGF